eukprot:jgi/Tetstr1/432949/TSEL_022287.t1
MIVSSSLLLRCGGTAGAARASVRRVAAFSARFSPQVVAAAAVAGQRQQVAGVGWRGRASGRKTLSRRGHGRGQRGGGSSARLLRRLQRAELTPRRAAVEQLIRIDADGAYSSLGRRDAEEAEMQGEIHGAEEGDPEGGGDASLGAASMRTVTELVNGVTRMQRRLDFFLSQCCDVATCDAATRAVLRVAMYELTAMGLPEHALNEHVQLAKQGVNEGAGRFANGVLRNFVRSWMEGGAVKEELLAREMGSVTGTLAVRESHPDWMVARWVEEFGAEDAAALLAWNNRRPHHSIRIAPGSGLGVEEVVARLRAGGVEAEPSEFLPREFVRVHSGLQALLSGTLIPVSAFAVQDESAGMVVAVLDPQPGEAILDCCAAPGGKTLAIAERMAGQGKLLAMDANVRRLQPLQRAVEARGLAAVVTLAESRVRAERVTAPAAHGVPRRETAADPANHGAFDRVLLDAPCSGLGVLAKRADLRWRRSLEDLQASTALAVELIQAARLLVAPGGVLVYSTCSLDSRENWEPVKALLSEPQRGAGPRFELEAPGPAQLPPHLCPNGAMETLPQRHGVDGAFAARLRRVA